MSFLPTSASLMSKRRNNDTSKDDTQATGKRARKATAGFRVARPPAAQSTSQSTVAVSTSSRITTLALGPKGRRVSKRQDKSRPATQSTPSTISSTAELLEDAYQAAPIDLELEVGPKPKRKRDNNTKVCDSVATRDDFLD